MAALPAVFIDGNTPEKDGPWFLMALVRRHFRWMRDSRSPQAILEAVIAAILAYWVAPVTLFFFWLRYLARQDMRGTLLHVLLIALSVAAATCLPTIVSRVLRPGDLYRKSKAVFPVVLSTL
jgi:heme A synthase